MNEVHVALTAKAGPTKPNATPPLLKVIHAVASCNTRHSKSAWPSREKRRRFQQVIYVAVYYHQLLDHLGRKPKPKKGAAPCCQFHVFIPQIKASFPQSTSFS